MKNIFLLLLFFTGMVEAQIVNIPDVNFKAALIADGIDTSGDGEIQTLEAFFVNQLHVDNANITSLIGLSSFVNVTALYCENNVITSLDLSGNPNINYIKCSYNQLSFLNLSNNPNLTDLLADHNNLISINLSNNPSLTDLWLFNNNLTTLDLSSCSSLRVLSCSDNLLTSLNLSANVNMADVQCANNMLTSINVSGLGNLTRLECSQNQLSVLNVSSNVNLQNLRCTSNQLTNLDLHGLHQLVFMYCGGNLLTTVDVSECWVLGYLICDSNPPLTSIYMKNGSEELVAAGLCPNLSFVCADDFQLMQVRDALIELGDPEFTITSYCTFVPGGNYNTITGNIRFDLNNDGCDASDQAHQNVRVNITDGTNSGATFLNNTGDYFFYPSAGNFTITPSVENLSYFTFSPPTASVAFSNNLNNIEIRNFCITANGVHRDAEMVISPVTPARPGFDAVYKLIYKNKGNQTDDLYLNFTYNDNLLDFVSATGTVTQGSGFVQSVIAGVDPFESGSIDITLHVNAPTDTPAVNIGDLLHFTSFVDITTDENWTDNAFTLNQTVVGSYDPNDITCLEGDVVAPSEIGNYLHYAINFENTGTFPAENVVVRTEVDAAKFDIGSLQLMNTNFPVDARISGNKVEFIFKNIQLPIGGHGHILLKIKTQNTLVTGDAVANRADIFFDYNFPIDTGLANTVFQTLSNSDFEIDNSVMIAPNPASNEVTIKANNVIKSIQLYDAQGRIITTSLTNTFESKLNLSSYSKGIYFIKIITKNGMQAQKLQKD